MASGGVAPTVPHCKTRAELLTEPFSLFMRGCTSADWASWSTLERCQVLVILRAGAIMADTGGQGDAMVIAYAADLSAFHKNMSRKSSSALSLILHSPSDMYAVAEDPTPGEPYPVPDWRPFGFADPSICKEEWAAGRRPIISVLQRKLTFDS